MSNLFPSLIRRSRINFQQIRHLPRWQHRRPIRVYENEEQAEKGIPLKENILPEPEPEVLKTKEPSQFKIKWNRPNNVEKLKPDVPLTINSKKPKKTPTVDMLQTVIDKDGNFIYTKMANNDPRVGSLLLEIKSKKVQESNKVILLEGKRLIKDALQMKIKLEYLIFSRMDEVEYLRPYLPKLGSILYKMPYREMQMWSDLSTNPGIMGIFKKPQTDQYEPTDSLPFTVILDNVREPNNLGAILRVCSGAGCSKVILTKGCTNLWDNKVLRSACGAHFRLQIHNKLEWDLINNMFETNYNIFVADNRGITTDREKTDADLILNTINLIPYFSINFKSIVNENNHIVLIIGGETEGISEECYKFCQKVQGARINIPMDNKVDSLNVSTALGIIAFEIKRQLLVK